MWTVGGKGCGWQEELKNRLTGKAVWHVPCQTSIGRFVGIMVEVS